MSDKSLLIGSAAAFALFGLVTATPALASQHPSTPEERAQTDALNAQQLERARSASPVPVASESSATVGATASSGAMSTVTPLSALANPPQTLANASVETSDGMVIGVVQKVVLANDGKAKSVDVSLKDSKSKVVELAANQLSYDQSRNVVVAQLTREQINAMPTVSAG